jgi:hypothetical protein
MNTEPNNDSRQDVQKPLSPRTKRMRLFLATYSLGAIVLFFMGPPLEEVSSRIGADLNFPLFLVEILFFLACTFIALPVGVVVPFIDGPYIGGSSSLQITLVLLSYMLTLLLPVFGSSTEKPRTFRRLYLLFIGLLVINVAGCSSLGPLSI